MRVLVEGVGLGDVAFQPVNGEVHFREADGVAVFSCPKNVTLLGRVAAVLLDEVAGLNKHAARAAGGIEHDAVVRLDDIDDGLHERGRREELAVVVRLCMANFIRKYS